MAPNDFEEMFLPLAMALQSYWPSSQASRKGNVLGVSCETVTHEPWVGSREESGALGADEPAMRALELFEAPWASYPT